jgi:hypothetical protein
VIDERRVTAVEALDDPRSWKRHSAKAPAG